MKKILFFAWVVLFIAGFASAAIPSLERQALIAIYVHTNGDSWSNKTGWKTPPLDTDGYAMPGTEGTWYGVTVTADKVTTISLHNNNLSGTIPAELGDLSGLENLYLHSNSLTGAIPTELGSLSNLKQLQLTHNQLTGSIPASFGSLANLTYLSSYDNQLSGSIPPELGSMAKLQNFSFAQNQLSGSIPKELANLSSLQIMSFAENQLSGGIPVELCGMSQLQGLYLYNNRLSGSIPTEFGNLVNLLWLRLDCNMFQGAIPMSLANLASLSVFYIGFNALYSNDADLTAFLESKQADWAASQTIAPANVTATGLNSTSIRLAWDAIPYSGDAGGYRVFTGTAPGGPYTFYAQTLDKTVTSMIVSGLTPLTSYYFVVQTRTDAHGAQQSTLDSEPSAEASAATLCMHTVTFVAGSGGTLSGETTQLVDYGSSCSAVTAVADVGFHFVDWTGSVSSTDNPLVIGNVTADMTVTANFAASNYTISGTVAFGGSPLAGVTLNGLPGNPMTDSAGAYSAGIAYGWSGTATPSHPYFTFTPSSATYSNVASDQTTDYTASLIQSLVVTAPALGALWEKRRTCSITWLKQGAQNANVKIMLYKGTSTLVTTIVSTTANDGSYDWLVPATLAVGSTYFIRVKTVDNLIKDDSDKFSIIVPTITVTAPTTGTVWVKEAVKTITWTKLGTQDANVKILLYKGTTKTLDISLSTENDGSFDWSIPPTPANGLYTLKVITLDGKVTGVSKAFTIAAGLVRVTSPATGAKWFRGMGYDITWTAEGTINPAVKIQLYRGTTLVSTLSSGTPTTTGAFNWTVPAAQAIGANYAVKVTALDNKVSARSGNFTIAAGAIAVTAPAAGASWQRGQPHLIAWTRQGDLIDDEVRIQLFKGTSLVSTIAAVTANDGGFEWTVPASQPLAANYRVRVATRDNLVSADSSKFAIVADAGLALLAPNGDAPLRPMEPLALRWTGDPDVLDVKLEFSRDNGGTFSIIADHVANTGSYDWLTPAGLTRNGIVRVSDASGRPWADEGLLELTFAFRLDGQGDGPAFWLWFGDSEPKDPGYGFAAIDIGEREVGFGGLTQAVEPLSGNWHELRVRLDFRRDAAEVRLDERVLFADAALGTTREHHFEPLLSLQAGREMALDLMLDDLAIDVVQLDGTGGEKQRFNVLRDDFERYDEANPLQSCWRGVNLADDKAGSWLDRETPGNKALRLRSAAGAPLRVLLPFSLPELVPFDISDRQLTVEP